MPAPIGASFRNRLNRNNPQKTQGRQESGPSNPQDTVQLSGSAQGGVPSISEKQERDLLKLMKGKGHLVQLNQGKRSGNVVTIHGINASPDSVRPLSRQSANEGKDVYTFVYDDRKSRLDKTSSELADSLTELQAGSKEPLTIRAHSMGGRLAVDALRKMKESGVLPSDVKLEMVNPVIGGVEAGNYAKLAPEAIAGLIPGAKPGKDMGTKSEFQRRLEATDLPKSVETTTYVGTEDHLVNPNDDHFKNVHDGLNGKVKLIPGADHDSAIDVVARRRP